MASVERAGAIAILSVCLASALLEAPRAAGTASAEGRLSEPADRRRGDLILIGGGDRPAAAMRTFVELAGGPEARILIVPTASELPDTGEFYAAELQGFGAGEVFELSIRERADAERSELVAQVRGSTGIFFAGGDQRRITAALLDTPVGSAIRAAWSGGTPVAGTSAGTACMSELMLTGDGDFGRLAADNVELTRGLGLLPGAILDQHFVARQRNNRLLSVVLEHPQRLGIGIDEATAIHWRDDDTLTVLGDGWVVIYDATSARIVRQPGSAGDLLGAEGVRLHILVPGDRFDLATRQRLAGGPSP